MPMFTALVVGPNTPVDEEFQYLMSLEFYLMDTSHQHYFTTKDIEMQRDTLDSLTLGGKTMALTSAPIITIRGETDRAAQPTPAYFIYHLYARSV